MTTKTRRPKSRQAQAASAIRTQLKAAFPHTSFSVTSRSYAGGNSVDIEWIDGPTEDHIDALTRQYQYGHFDGMYDIYEHSNTRDDIPQVRYVQTRRSTSRPALVNLVQQLNKYRGFHLKVSTASDWIDPWSDEHTGIGQASHEIRRTFHSMPLVCPTNKHATLPGDAYCPECGDALPPYDPNKY